MHVLQIQVLLLLQHWHQRMFSPPRVTTVSSHFLGFLERSPPRGPSLSTGPSMCSEAESTLRWWRWKMWKMEQVCVYPAASPWMNKYVSIHVTLPEHWCNFPRVSSHFLCNCHGTHSLLIGSLWYPSECRKSHLAILICFSISFHSFVVEAAPLRNW